MPYWSEVRTFVPQSRIARPSLGRLTTVARTRIAQFAHAAVPVRTVAASLKTQVPARCSVSIGNFSTLKRAGVPPPDTIGTGMPARLNSSSAWSKKTRVSGSRFGNVMRPWKSMWGSFMTVWARSNVACGVCTPFRAPPVSHSMTKRTSRPWRAPASERPRATTSLSSTTVRRSTRRATAIRRSSFARPRMLYVRRTSGATP